MHILKSKYKGSIYLDKSSRNPLMKALRYSRRALSSGNTIPFSEASWDIQVME